MMTRKMPLCAAMALILGGCGDKDRGPVLDGLGGGDGSADDGTGGDGGDDGTGGDGSDDGGDDGTGGDDGGIKYDVENDGTGGPGDEEEGCARVDFLFVVDNSLSMSDEQQYLSSSFPDFIATIQAEVVGDYHVMVIDTDGEDKWDEELAECYGGDCEGEPPDEPCGVLPPENGWPCGNLPEIDACDPVLGGGTDHDGSDARGSCNLAGGRRWFDEAQPNQGQAFECIANLYDGNSPELTMQGMLAALGPSMVGPGGCNEGFLRQEDSVLVVTFISDEEDDGDSPGTPQSWHDDLLALKNGNETAVVVLGLLGDTGLPNAVCPPDSVPGSNGGEYSPRLIEFVESWGSMGLWGSVCEEGYKPFFDQAVALIDQACDEYQPEG